MATLQDQNTGIPPCAAVILAAGKSTRMKSKKPKSLHPICGSAITRHVIRACKDAGVDRVVVVVGHQADMVKAGIGDDVEYAIQAAQRGTGDAVAAAKELLQEWQGTILILTGDAPLIRAKSLSAVRGLQAETGAELAMLTARSDNA